MFELVKLLSSQCSFVVPVEVSSGFIEIQIFTGSCCTNVSYIVYFSLNFLHCKVIRCARAASSTEAQCQFFLFVPFVCYNVVDYSHVFPRYQFVSSF